MSDRIVVKEWGYNRGLIEGQKQGAVEELEKFKGWVETEQLMSGHDNCICDFCVALQGLQDKVEKRLKGLGK
jgi:hypothetical protein